MASVNINNESILLKTLLELFPDEMLGREHFKKYGANMQFLTKYLDSAERLHIQAHPTINFAKKYFNSDSGKTEAYVILNIREEVNEPYIYLGFQKPVAPDELKNIIVNQDIGKLLSCFEKIHVKKGDVFIVPGGLPHAIGKGIFMIEIMEPTDFVVRLEFERSGYVLPEKARFMGRNVDFAINMIDYNSYSPDEIHQKYFCPPVKSIEQNGGGEYILINKKQTPCFSVHKLIISKSFVKNSNSFYVGITARGSGVVNSGNQKEYIKAGDRFFIPYQTKEVEYTADEELEIILTFPPEPVV